MSKYIRPLGRGKHAVVCPWSEAHTSGTDGDGSTVIFDGEDGRPPAFKCSHSHCIERGLRDVLAILDKAPSRACDSGLPASSSRSASTAFAFKSLKALFAEPEEQIPWVVDGMLAAGGTSIFAAKPKAGKTTVSSQCAISVARGLPFLGRSTKKGPVLHLAVEEKRSEVIKRYRDQNAFGDEEIYIHASSSPPQAIELLKPIILRYKPALVIVDTLFRVVPIDNGNDYSEVTRALARISHQP